MISVAIDGVEIEGLSPTTLSLALSAERMRSVEGAAADCDFTFTLDIESHNSAAHTLFSGDGFLHDGEPFNSVEHWGEVRCEGEVMVSGRVVLLSTVVGSESVSYTIRLRQSGAEWAQAAEETLVHDVELDYYERLDMETMEGSWSDNSVVKYFPVHRDSYEATYSSVSFDTVQRLRSVDDYHPFINIRELMVAIFDEQGYTVESDFMESDQFKRLYISGAYASQSSSEAKAAMDFYAVKLAGQSTVADYRGRVNISPLYSSNSVGYLVDFDSIDERAECYSLGGALTIESGVLTFTPTQAVSVGFEVRLKYTADYTVESRTALKTFDTLYLEGSMLYDYTVANRFTDQRDEALEMLFEYKVVAFDGSSTATYDLTIMVNGVETSLGSWTGIWGEVTTPRFTDSDTVNSPKLYVTPSGGSRAAYSGDWALYMGYVELEGEVEVDITIRTPPQSASPSSPIKLTAPFISGAAVGANFTLLAETSLQPFFAGYPGYGSYVDFSELSQYDGVYASKFVESVRQLFNLAIFSDVEGKRVLIEPEEDIYALGSVWDWSDRVVESEPITFSDVAIDGARQRKWGYQANDGVTTRIAGFYYEAGETYPDAPESDPVQSVENSSSPNYGTWLVDTLSFAADYRVATELNPMLSPTINDTVGVPIVGDRDNPDMVDTLDFSPRVLSFEGFMWSENEWVPNTVFFSEEQGVNLCFEDREGVRGLNKYYSEAVERLSSGQYVELTLRLSAGEVVGLTSPVEGRASMLSTFRLTLGGESCLARLESVEMEAGVERVGDSVARCKFLIIK
ncbi:MAG: hypothetical protein SNG14_07615 [Rikenellaceae bacterium]